MEQKKWGIIGGGVMGMTLALRLAQKGEKVTLFEASPNLGGLVSYWKLGEIEWDKFYHVILLSDFYTRNLLKELDLEDKIEWVETKTGFYMNGKLHSMSTTIEFLMFPTLSLFDKFRLACTILLASKIKSIKRLENIPLSDWLLKWSGNKVFNRIWLPLLRAKLGDSYKRTSAVFIWATINRLYGARRSGLKREMFGYIPGGYKRIIETFEKKISDYGVIIKTGHSVSDIRPTGNDKLSVSFGNGKNVEFDNVILTLPSGVSAKLCTGLLPDEIYKLNNVEYLGVICAALLLDKSVSSFYVTNVTDSWVPFTGVIEMSALVEKKYLGGNTLIYLPKYITKDDPLFSKSDEEIKEFFLQSFKKMYPSIKNENIKFAGIARASHVLPVLTLNYSEKLPNIKTSLPGVYIINTAHIQNGTLNVNETIKVAESKLNEILLETK